MGGANGPNDPIVPKTVECPNFKAVVHFNSLEGIITRGSWFSEPIRTKADYHRGHELTTWSKNEDMWDTYMQYLSSAVFASDDMVSGTGDGCNATPPVNPPPTPVNTPT